MTALLLIAGGTMLYFGAEWLVGGASRLALAYRAPQLIVGLTVVAYGTSAPEMIVGIQSARGGHGAVAVGNVIGSNIANLGLILGVSFLVRPARVDGAIQRRELPVLLATVVLLAATLYDGRVDRWEAIVLLVLAVAYTGWMVRSTRGAAVVEARVDTARAAEASRLAGGAPVEKSRGYLAATAALGLGVLLAGGHFFVEGATAAARAWGMSERTLGLTIVAVGTSLPELVISVIAAARGNSDIAIGNVVGSNIFNVLLCLGAAAIAGPIEMPWSSIRLDLTILVAMTLVTCLFLRTQRVTRRWEGVFLVAAYAAFVVFALVL